LHFLFPLTYTGFIESIPSLTPNTKVNAARSSFFIPSYLQKQAFDVRGNKKSDLLLQITFLLGRDDRI
ncbi:MAG: hypothetical protein KJN59_04635, partial [Bacteroidia bacterium]|nr:hypothetical protein [Bacteroidia bacterium]